MFKTEEPKAQMFVLLTIIFTLSGSQLVVVVGTMTGVESRSVAKNNTNNKFGMSIRQTPV
mgnify:FL=1